MLSDLGCKRKINEDQCACIQPEEPELAASKGILAIVADGMGGYSGGEVASVLAVNVIRQTYYASKSETGVDLE